MKKFALLFIALVTIFVVSACGNGDKTSGKSKETITIKDDLNKEGVKVPKNPKKSSYSTSECWTRWMNSVYRITWRDFRNKTFQNTYLHIIVINTPILKRFKRTGF